MKKRKKDFNKKSFINPFFSRKSASKLGLKKKLYLASFIFIIFSLIYIFWFSSIFNITEVEIVGGKFIDKDSIRQKAIEQTENKRFALFSQKNIFFFDNKNLIKSIQGNLLVGEFKIDKKLFSRKIVIDIKEKITSLAWLSGSESYLLDLEGVAVKQVKSSDLLVEPSLDGTEVIRPDFGEKNAILVYDESNTEVEVGKGAAKKELIIFVVELSEKLLNRADFEVSYYIVTGGYADQITMHTTEGWYGIFRITDSVDLQIERLFLILRQKVQSRSSLEYVDLRFEEKVFYK